MEVLVSGGTGLIGGRLVRALCESGSRVRVLSRRPEAAAGSLPREATPVGWDGLHFPAEATAGAGAVVHLAGEPLFGGPLTAARRRRVYDSRVESTRSLVATLGGLDEAERPRTLVCASAVGLYGDRGEELLDEDAAPGHGFLADLCRDWEAAAAGAGAHGVRVVHVRIGVVLSRDGGALALMAKPFRLGLGGRLGSGRQWFPWIHIADVVGLLRLALEDERVQGPLNAAAPEPVRNAELTRALGEVLGRPTLLPVPGFALRIALGELAGELLGSRRVMPARARALGFDFAHAELASALRRELGGEDD